MQFDVETVNSILGIDDAYKAPEKIMELISDKESREVLFKRFLNVSSDLSFDWFHQYFEDEQAQRKKMKQDFTPDSVARLLSRVVNADIARVSKANNDGTHTYFEPTAGTGGILISHWDFNRRNDALNFKGKNGDHQLPKWASVLTYDSRRYWYQAEEMSDRAVPFLLFNMAIRGMNGVVIQCNVLTRQTKDIWFIRNDTPDPSRFSEIIKLPHTELWAKEFNVAEWVTEFK